METWLKKKISDLFKNKFNYNPLVVAEISANHNKNIKKIIKIINNSKNIGIDAIKIQLYKPEEITLNVDSPDFEIKKNNSWSRNKSFYNLYKKGSTPYEWYPKLSKLCKKKKILFFASVFDLKTVDFLEKHKCPIYKIASPEITDLPLIKKVARTKKPVFISTGLANKKDIQEALKVLKENNCRRIILMKCTSSYPAPLEEINLKTMQQYEKTFNVKVGYSDHTLNNSASMAATALGARVIEKHIVLNDKIKSLDSFFSMNLNNFKIFVKNIREVGKCIGSISYKISKSSKKNLNGRKSLYVSEDIKKGDIFSIKNIKSVRPSYGLHPKYLYRFVGKKSKKNLKKGERLKISLLR